MKIMVGSEHAGVDYRIKLVSWLKNSGYSVTEVRENEQLSGYPDVAEEVAIHVIKKEYDLGILICGTGIGMCMAAGKIPGTRVALCTDAYMGKMAREHNNANILAFGSRVIGFENMLNTIETFLAATYQGERHELRLQKLASLENKYLRIEN
ncbi:MAG: ribose 5-phosphate isomerase B [Flexilinea sp.]